MVELDGREDRSRPTRRKLSLIVTLSTSNLTWTAPASNPSLLREQPADGYLSYVWKSSSYPTDNRSRVHYEDQLVGAVRTRKWSLGVVRIIWSTQLHCVAKCSFSISPHLVHIVTIELQMVSFFFPLRSTCWRYHSKNSVALVRTRTIPTERLPPVGEISANFCG